VFHHFAVVPGVQTVVASLQQQEQQRQHLQEIVHHLQGDGVKAVGTLLEAFSAHVDRLCQEWSLAHAQLSRMQARWEEWENMCDLQQDLIRMETLHAEQLSRRIARTQELTCKKEREVDQLREQQSAAQRELSLVERRCGAVRYAARTQDKQHSLEAENVHHLRTQFRAELQRRDHQKFLLAQLKESRGQK
jgi:hypothetical protein